MRGRLLIRLLALAGLALVLWRMPMNAPLLWGWLRLDGLSAAFGVFGLLGVVLMLQDGQLRSVALAAGWYGLAVCAHDLRLTLMLCVAGALLPTLSRGQRVALLLQSAVLLALGWRAASWRWDAPMLGGILSSWHVALLLVAALLALQLLPLAEPSRAALPFVPAFALYLLLRLYELGPLNWGWTGAAAFAGCAGAFGCALRALRARHDPDCLIRISRAWWGLALAPALLGSEAGIAASWTFALVAVLALGVALAAPALAHMAVLAMLPLTLPWAALWLGIAALQAGGVPIASGLVWLLGVLLTVAAGRVCLNPAAPAAPLYLKLIAGWSVVLGILLPLVVQRLLLPIFPQIGAGLTPFGRPLVQPWTGLSVRNAGSETVATLPSLVLAGLMLVAAALAYGLVRILPLRSADPLPAAPERFRSQTLWKLVQRMLPTAPSDSDEHP